MKKKLIRIISCILVSVLALSCVNIAFAANTCSCGITPTIYVTGFGSKEIKKNIGKKNEEVLFPPTAEKITSSIGKTDIMNISNFLITKNYSKLSSALNSIVTKSMGDLGCDADGNVKDNTGIEWSYQTDFSDHSSKRTYSYYYDWRADPMEISKGLNDYINYVCEKTGHDKVNLIGFSMGSLVSLSYIKQFGDSKVESLTLSAPAFNGVSCAGQPFNKQLKFSTEALSRYMYAMMPNDPTMTFVKVLIEVLSKTPAANILDDFVNDILDNCKDDVYSSLTDIFVTMPGIWSLVPYENYESAKSLLLSDKEKYAKLIEKADNYHNNVQKNNGQIIDKLISDGARFGIIAKYNLQDCPVIESLDVMSDTIIDTKFASFGATCSKLTQTLGSNYKQANTSCGHNHLSSDNIIDASTCRYPENTWFVKELPHSFGCDDYDELELFIAYGVDGKAATVHDNAQYPQFIKYDSETDSLMPLDSFQESELNRFMNNGSIIGLTVKLFVAIESLIKANVK